MTVPSAQRPELGGHDAASAPVLDPAARHRAALVAVQAAHDLDEARMFLAMLGLDNPAPPPS